MDACAAMLKVARRHYPELDLVQDRLPALAGIGDAVFDHALCIAVFMHLPMADK